MAQVTTPAHTEHAERVTVAGGGYVGLTTAVWLAAAGHAVTIVDIDRKRVAELQAGRSPIHEDGLEDLLRHVLESGCLTITDRLDQALAGCGLAVVCVGTPSLHDGRADLTAIDSVVAGIGEHATDGTVVVIKSTVPPGTALAVSRRLSRAGRRLPVVSCPEFLREGSAIADLAAPARHVVGGDDPVAVDRVARLMDQTGCEVVLTDNTSAELIKYGSNAFLAVKISFINEMANLCELLGGDVASVARGMGGDPRIGRSFLNAGLGFGGSCFPKDTRALDQAAARSGYGFWMLKAAMEVNERQRMRFVHRIRDAVGGHLEGRRVALLGLAFKPGTDDLRQAPAIDIALRLQELGATVAAHDPVAMPGGEALLPGVIFAADPYAAAADADVVALVTEWPEYRDLDWVRIRGMLRSPVVVDGRNALDGEALGRLGFNYEGIGRPPVTRWSRRGADRSVA